jgi:small redox-active disulfide protein 2
MAESEVMQIRISNNLIGIVGLKKVMEGLAKERARYTDDAIGNEILNRVSKLNYIPPRAKEQCAKAFAREFKKYLGKPVDEDVPAGLRVVVLGPGCAQCGRLESDVMDVMQEMGLVADFQHITDVREIGKYGVMGTPALLINDRVVSAGTTPPKDKIKAWLTEAQGGNIIITGKS